MLPPFPLCHDACLMPPSAFFAAAASGTLPHNVDACCLTHIVTIIDAIARHYYTHNIAFR